MTRWGLLLLFTFLALGLSHMASRKAGRVAVLVTSLVLSYVMAKYGALR